MGWAAVAQVAVGAIAANQAAGAAADASAAQRQAADAAKAAFGAIKVPTIEEQSVILQSPELMGQYTPEQQQAMQMGVSAMEGVKADQSTVNAQKDALSGISDVANGGYSESDKATARQVNRDISQQSVARRNAILNQMASRGVLGSGMELAAQLQGEQQSVDAASKAGDSLIQNAQARSLQALTQQGTLAGQMRSQDVGEQSDIARAKDTINQFNTQNAQNVANSNVASRNQAQLTNLQAKQSQEDQRAALANQQQMYNKQLLQTRFANQTGQAVNMNAANQAAANADSAAAQARAGMIQGIGSAVVGGIGAYASNSAANDQAEKNRQNALAIAQANALK